MVTITLGRTIISKRLLHKPSLSSSSSHIVVSSSYSFKNYNIGILPRQSYSTFITSSTCNTNALETTTTTTIRRQRPFVLPQQQQQQQQQYQQSCYKICNQHESSSSLSFYFSTSASSSSTDNTSININKISARVFCNKDGFGGNPLTIFYSNINEPSLVVLTKEQQSKLAQTCSWESVFLVNKGPHDDNEPTAQSQSSTPAFEFYLPTGEEVSFCAHAALGGSVALSNMNSIMKEVEEEKVEDVATDSKTKIKDSVLVKFGINYNVDDSNSTSTSTSSTTAESIDHLHEAVVRNNNSSCTNKSSKDSQQKSDTTTTSEHDTKDNNNNMIQVSLKLKNILWKEEPIINKSTLYRIIRTNHNIQDYYNTLPREPPNTHSDYFTYYGQYPHLLSSTLYNRSKTIICVKTTSILNTIVKPPFDSEFYKDSCDAIDYTGTTGLYFYSPSDPIIDDETVNTGNNENDNDSSSSSDDEDSSDSDSDSDSDDDNNTKNKNYEVLSYDCRQFPRASGYPEDPATGIAAAALALSLADRRIEYINRQLQSSSQQLPTMFRSAVEQNKLLDEQLIEKKDDLFYFDSTMLKYIFHQGYAMNQPSLIQIENITFTETIETKNNNNDIVVQNDTKLQKETSATTEESSKNKKFILYTNDDPNNDGSSDPNDLDEEDEGEYGTIDPSSIKMKRTKLASFDIIGNVVIDKEEIITI